MQVQHCEYILLQFKSSISNIVETLLPKDISHDLITLYRIQKGRLSFLFTKKCVVLLPVRSTRTAKKQ